MNIWIINASEPLPIDDAKGRLLRCGILCEQLLEQGHNVTWWSSTFHHARKFQRYESTTVEHPSDNLKIVCLKGRRYIKHVSISRVLNHFETGLRFYRLAEKEARPDVILCSFPLIELALAATQRARKWKVPIILDIRDLWPDIFESEFTGWKRIFAKPVIFPFAWATRISCRRADAITGITRGLMEWGVKKAGRTVAKQDLAFCHGYKQVSIDKKSMLEKQKFWRDRNLNPDMFIVTYFGAINSRHEFNVILTAAHLLRKDYPKLRFALCGNGDHLEQIRENAKGLENVIIPGWIPHIEMNVLAQMSSLGLAPYKSEYNYLESIPTKAIEYFSHGLPVLSSLQGALEKLLREEECGVTYLNDSPESLVESLTDLIENPEKVIKMQSNSLKLFEANYDSDKVYGEMAGYIESFA